MKAALPILAFCAISLAATAQSVEYGYDACGNRVARRLVLDQFGKDQPIADPQDDFAEEQLGSARIRIYPNPTCGHLKVTIHCADEPQGSIEVFDTHGNRAVDFFNIGRENDIDLSSRPGGVYFVRLCLADDVSTWKIIKK